MTAEIADDLKSAIKEKLFLPDEQVRQTSTWQTSRVRFVASIQMIERLFELGKTEMAAECIRFIKEQRVATFVKECPIDTYLTQYMNFKTGQHDSRELDRLLMLVTSKRAESWTGYECLYTSLLEKSLIDPDFNSQGKIVKIALIQEAKGRPMGCDQLYE